jgi:TfoX/Sxy family transcriptional regulator of competence genes
MSCTIDFIDYIIDQLAGIGEITSKKMFGEYMIYVNLKPVILVCDDIAYLKKWDNIKDICSENECGFPYNGAKEHYILDIDDKELLIEIIKEVEKVAKIPIKKKRKEKV